MHLGLTDEEILALLDLLIDTIENLTAIRCRPVSGSYKRIRCKMCGRGLDPKYEAAHYHEYR
jgi:hypothetical protein